MKGYGELASRYFKQNKVRNIATILGIVIACILFISTTYIVDFSKKVNIIIEEANVGPASIVLDNLSLDDINRIENNVKVEKSGVIQTYLTKEQDVNLEIYKMSKNTYEWMLKHKIKIDKGKFPVKKNEILVAKGLVKYVNKKIGDNIEINGQKYDIVGIFSEINESNRMYSSTKEGSVIVTSYKGKSVNSKLCIEFKNKNIRNINQIENALNIKLSEQAKVALNTEEGMINGNYFGIYGINIVIIIFTIILVYGVINISLKERERQIGLLRCIGATKEKIRYLVFKEGLILSILSIIPGIFLGEIIAIKITKIFFEKEITKFKVPIDIYWSGIIIATILIFLTVVISAIYPVYKFTKLSPIEAIKPFRKEKVNYSKKGKWIRKKLGYKIFLAYRGSKKYSKSFYITTIILALLLSGVCVFTTYYYLESKGLEDSRLTNKSGISIYISSSPEMKWNKIKDLEREIEEYTGNKGNIFLNENLDGEINNIELASKIDNIEKENDKRYGGTFHMMVTNDKWYEQNKIYIKGIDSLSLFNKNGAVFVDANVNKGLGNTSTRKLIESKKGEVSTIKMDKNVVDIVPMGTIEPKDVIGLGLRDNYKNLRFIVSESFFKKNIEKFKGLDFSIEINFNVNKNTEGLNSIIKNAEDLNGFIVNNKENNKAVRESLNSMGLVVYVILGMLFIIVMISIINNKVIYMNLRKREIGAMLAIGMNRKSLKRVFFYEGIIQGVASVVIGWIISLPSMTILWVLLRYGGETLENSIPIEILILGSIVVIGISILSSILPIKKINFEEILDMMKDEE